MQTASDLATVIIQIHTVDIAQISVRSINWFTGDSSQRSENVTWSTVESKITCLFDVGMELKGRQVEGKC